MKEVIKKRRLILCMTGSLVMVGAPVVSAAGPGGGGKDGKEGKDKDELPKFEDVTKDMEVKEGFFTLYYDKKKDTLLAQIPKTMLDEPFLVSISIPRGPTFASWMMGEAAVYWQRHNNKLLLMESNTRQDRGKGSTVEDVIGRTYTDAIIRALEVKTEASGGDPVVDLGDLLKNDLIGLGEMYGQRKLDASLSRWRTKKAFPDNVELAVDAAMMDASGGLISSVYASMSRLPKNGYTPREADDRVGYILSAKQDWATDHESKTVFKRYVHRWNLEKQDPDAEVSPVKDPIVFYIEKTVPVRYRRHVRDGILEWNKAFEKCGFLAAVQVRQQTDANEWKDMDPEDVRYNFFRWIVSGRAFARGPSHANPFTGQILDADIVFDDSMARYYLQDYSLMGPPGTDSLSDPVAEAFYDRHPEFQFVSPREALTPEYYRAARSIGTRDAPDPVQWLRSQHEDPCELGGGMVRQMAFGQLANAHGAGGRNLPEEFIGQVIKEVVMHEVGHTLGLRHNFKASAWKSVEEITSNSAQDQPLTGSVMDYNPAEFAGTEGEQGNFITRTLGPYDYWAIEYGYRPLMKGGELKSEADMLKSIASRAADAGLAYATDEDTSDFGPDPLVYRFDNGSDPVAFAKHRMRMVDTLTKDLVDRAVDDGESYARLRRAFNIVLGEYSFAARMAARTVGGQLVNRDHKGDPNGRTPFEILPAAKQREALSFLADTVFSSKSFQFPPDLLNRLGAGRFWHWDSDELDTDLDYDLHETVLRIQSRVLTLLLNPMTVNRIYDAELKVASEQDAMTMHELVSSLTKSIWSELDQNDRGQWTNRRPRITSFRRNLQRDHLRRLSDVLVSESGVGWNADTRAVVRMTMKDLGEKIGKVLESSKNELDTYSLAHLDEAGEMIRKALEAEFEQRS